MTDGMGSISGPDFIKGTQGSGNTTKVTPSTVDPTKTPKTDLFVSAQAQPQNLPENPFLVVRQILVLSDPGLNREKERDTLIQSLETQYPDGIPFTRRERRSLANMITQRNRTLSVIARQINLLSNPDLNREQEVESLQRDHTHIIGEIALIRRFLGDE